MTRALSVVEDCEELASWDLPAGRQLVVVALYRTWQGLRPLLREAQDSVLCKLGLAAVLLAYLIGAGPMSLIALILGVTGDGWAGALSGGEQVGCLVAGASLPLTLSAAWVFGTSIRKPPVAHSRTLCLLGLAIVSMVCGLSLVEAVR